MKELPEGATPLDFAFHIHSKVGHHCAGAKINGRLMPLGTPLKNGDVVEIIAAPVVASSATCVPRNAPMPWPWAATCWKRKAARSTSMWRAP